MSIDPIKFGFAQIKPIEGLPGGQAAAGVEPAGAHKSFGQALNDAMKEVDGLQLEADRQIEGLALGKGGVTTHGAMIALEKADLAFQLMTTIRSKILRAYEEVMRTSV